MHRIREHLERQAEERQRLIAQWPVLQHFMSSYFHQDWDHDADSPYELIEEFGAANDTDTNAALAAEIERYVDLPQEAKPSLDDLGSHYIPSQAGESDDEWLSSLRARLLG